MLVLDLGVEHPLLVEFVTDVENDAQLVVDVVAIVVVRVVERPDAILAVAADREAVVLLVDLRGRGAEAVIGDQGQLLGNGEDRFESSDLVGQDVDLLFELLDPLTITRLGCGGCARIGARRGGRRRGLGCTRSIGLFRRGHGSEHDSTQCTEQHRPEILHSSHPAFPRWHHGLRRTGLGFRRPGSMIESKLKTIFKKGAGEIYRMSRSDSTPLADRIIRSPVGAARGHGLREVGASAVLQTGGTPRALPSRAMASDRMPPSARPTHIARVEERRSGGDRSHEMRAVMLAAACASLALFGASVLEAPPAAAHARSVSYSSWVVDASGADVSLRLSLLELSRLGPDALPPVDGAAADLSQRLVLESDGARCTPRGEVRRSADAEGWVRYRWRVACETEAGALAVASQVLLDVAPTHLHFARVRFAARPEDVREQILTESAPRFRLRDAGTSAADAAAPGSRFVDYLVLGMRHILSGWDHLAFLFGLVLLSERFATIARLVTGFTLAHSLTLALGVLDLVHPRAAAVEAVIAFSVAIVAIEKGWLVAGRPRAFATATLAGLAGMALVSSSVGGALPITSWAGLILFTGCYFALAARSRDERLRIALTFAFGLVHGFGFAGILLEMELPTGRLVPALAGFNLGVEIGQIAIVLAAWPALALANRIAKPAWRDWTRDLATAGLCGLGCYWMLERALSLPIAD